MSSNTGPFTEHATFLGIWNVSQSRRQPKGETGKAITLSRAVNIDIDDEGGVISRPGYGFSASTSSVTAAYSRRDYQVGYLVDNGSLKRVTPGLDIATLGTVPTTDTYWLEIGNRVFMSTGYIVEGDTLLDWRVQPPEQPVVTVDGGNLTAGQYQIVITRLSSDGRESGSSVPLTITVGDNGGIILAGTEGCVVYVTGVDSDVFYEAGYEVTLITDVEAYNYPMPEDLLMAAALPENVGPIAYFQDCVYWSVYDAVKHETTIGWSSPFKWHIFDVFNDLFMIPGEVRLMVAYGEELIIGTDKEILVYNGEKPTKVAQYGVPKGQQYVINRDNRILFQSVRGVCTMPFANLTSDKVALPLGTHCSCGWVEMNGMEKFITLTDGTGDTDNSTIF